MIRPSFIKIKSISRGDRLVFVAALALVMVLYALLWQRQGHGAEALVMVDGKPWARLDLFHNQDLHVPGPLGESHIQVLDGQARFVDSPCPNKLCVHTGWIKQGGETAVCLPNRVSLQILAADMRFDTINF